MRKAKANVGVFKHHPMSKACRGSKLLSLLVCFLHQLFSLLVCLTPSMAEALESSAKRAKTAGSYTLDTDLNIIVDDETVHVHSIVLMLASPVFLQMLKSDMGEASQRRINLMGNLKDQFKVFWDAVKPVAYAGALLRS